MQHTVNTVNYVWKRAIVLTKTYLRFAEVSLFVTRSLCAFEYVHVGNISLV